jgi:hypothetical protein
MSDEYIIPGHYKLLSAVITTLSGKSVDIISLMPVFSIEESINKDSIRGFATIYDNIGFIEDLPLRGEELLSIEVEDALKRKIAYEFAIYKVSEIEIKKTNDGLVYKIFFMSKYSYEAMFFKIIKSFNNTVSTIADEIFKSTYPDQKSLVIEPTTGIFRCVMPNYNPMQALNFLTQRAYSTSSPSSSFRFFETSNSYFFVTDEYLIKEAYSNTDSIKEFTYSDAIEKTGKSLVEQLQNLIEIKNSDRVNTVDDILSGAYRARTIEIDINYRKVTLPGKTSDNEYDYQKEKTKYTKMSRVFGGEAADEPHSQEFVSSYFNTENEKRYIVVKDWDESSSKQLRGDQFIPDIVMNRNAYRHHLNNTVVHAKANGRLDLNAGNIINLKVLEFNSSNSKGFNRQLSGYYMISDLTHYFERDNHQTVMKLVKYDWGTEE